MSGKVDAAEQMFRTSQGIIHRLCDRQGEVTVLNNLGLVAGMRGPLDKAERYCEQALPILREVQTRREEGVVLFQLAHIAAAQKDFAQAEEVLHWESLAIAREIENTRDISDSLLVPGRLLINGQQQRQEGCHMLGEAVQPYAKLGVEYRAAAAEDLMRRLGCAQDA